MTVKHVLLIVTTATEIGPFHRKAAPGDPARAMVEVFNRAPQ